MSDGYCEVSLDGYADDAEYVEMLETRDVVARKDHRCIECRGPIQKGERHRVSSYKFEGTFQSERVCATCREVSGEFKHSVLGGSLWEFMGEEWDNGAHVQACMNRLESAKAKAKMQEQYNKFIERRAESKRRMDEWRRERATK